MSEVEAVPKTVEEKEVKEDVPAEKKEDVQEEKKEEVSIEEVEKALQLMAQGKRNMLCGEVPDAVNQFQEATKILAGKYGETAKECGDVYLSYGKSLLEMSRMETGVLGNALDGIEEEEEDSESKSESSDDKIEDAEKVTDEDTATEAESEDLNTEEEDAGEGTAEEKEGEEKKEEEEDVSNLQLAWEVFELAKKIFKDDADEKETATKEVRLKLAETHLKLGEVALETEQYESAIGDFKECLTVQQSVLEANDRLLAETHYQLGVAYNLAFQYDESVENFKSAQSVMEAKIKALEKVIEEGEKQGKGKDIADFEDPVYKAHKEVKEMKEILPDIVTKIEDVLEEQKTAEVAKAELKGTIGFEKAPDTEKAGESLSGAGEGSSSQPANVITHMVRKKRKTEADDEKDDTKKAKIENGSGDAPESGVNGGANGHTSPEKKEPAAATAMETEEVKTKTVEDVKKATEEAQSS